MSSEIEKLGKTLDARISKKIGGNKDLLPEIGAIQSNGGLKVNTVGNTIPRGDYMVSKELNLNSGDRVLVIWCGHEPVVVSVIKNS